MNENSKLALFNILIKNEIENLISYLNIEYPKIITNDIKNKLIHKYTNNFKILTILKEKNVKKINMKVKKKLLNKKFKIKYHRKIFKNQCEARIWNGGIITEDNYGSRCSRSKIDKSIYCKQHTIHNKHGNYLEKTNEKSIKEFEKHNK